MLYKNSSRRMSFRCDCCNFSAKTKQNYETHLKSKKHHDNTAKLQRSVNVCDNPGLRDMLEKLNSRMERIEHENSVLRDDNTSLKKDIAILKSHINDNGKSNTTQVHHGHGDINNYHIHLNLTKYGTEAYPDDTKALTDAIRSVNKAIPSLVKLRHFDPRRPENNNIKIPNKKQNKIQIYDGQRWITEDKRMTIEDKLQDFTNFMDTDEGQRIYSGCSVMIREKLDKLLNFCDRVYSGEKLTRVEQRELKRISGDVENIILDHQCR